MRLKRSSKHFDDDDDDDENQGCNQDGKDDGEEVIGDLHGICIRVNEGFYGSGVTY
jgi:hypothetical protein